MMKIDMGKFWDKDKWENVDEAYVGNIWGWKFSIFSLIFILLLVGVMIYRHSKMDSSNTLIPNTEQVEKELSK